MIDDKPGSPVAAGAAGAEAAHHSGGGAQSDESGGSRTRASRSRSGGQGEPPEPAPSSARAVVSSAQAAELEQSARPVRPAHPPHLRDVVDLGGARTPGVAPIVEQPILILIESLRADAKAFISLRDDQRAAWSEGNVSGLVGFSLSTTKDPTIYMRSFLASS
jgi:hypothetical protein